MLRRLLLLICFAGIAVYSVKIYQLKDTISFLPSKQNADTKIVSKAARMRMNFYMESNNASLLQSCQSFFELPADQINLEAHPANPKIAILRVIRDFGPEAMSASLELQKKLQQAGCLKDEKSNFSFIQLK